MSSQWGPLYASRGPLYTRPVGHRDGDRTLLIETEWTSEHWTTSTFCRPCGGAVRSGGEQWGRRPFWVHI